MHNGFQIISVHISTVKTVHFRVISIKKVGTFIVKTIRHGNFHKHVRTYTGKNIYLRKEPWKKLSMSAQYSDVLCFNNVKDHLLNVLLFK
jgi:hypothetical protein